MLKIPPNLPFPKGGIEKSPFPKGGREVFPLPLKKGGWEGFKDTFSNN
jgi:hypothetical protein